MERRPRRPPTSDAWPYLVRLLKTRPRSEQEVRSRLRGRGVIESEIDRVVSVAKEAGLIDDRVFARLWIEDRVLYHPLARDAVARELSEKGVAPSLVEAALQETYPEGEERKLAWRLAQERYERLADLDDVKRERRTLGFLTRRGFAFGLAREIVRRLARGEHNEQE